MHTRMAQRRSIPPRCRAANCAARQGIKEEKHKPQDIYLAMSLEFVCFLFLTIASTNIAADVTASTPTTTPAAINEYVGHALGGLADAYTDLCDDFLRAEGRKFLY